MASPLIVRYSGGENEQGEITSSGTHVLLHFVSGNVTNVLNRGFLLQHSGES